MLVSHGIETSSAVILGKPVIRETRISAELIIRKPGEGATEDDLLDAYPHPNRSDIQAVLLRAAHAPSHESISTQAV
jgi:uncharacterized protein (DUF433 family)